MPVIALAAIAAIWASAGSGTAHASPKPAPPCRTAFPGAREKTIGRTTWWNRQESVRQVLCHRFGLDPSADFPISAGMVCGVLSQVIGKYAHNLGLYMDGSCSGADIASAPKEPVKYISAVCGWASDLLGIARKQLGTLGAVACATAPSVGTGFGAALESKHEFDVAIDVIQRGMCVKYSPTHFGSPWLSERCARGDKGFRTLPVHHAPSPGGGGGGGGAGGGDAGGAAPGDGGGVDGSHEVGGDENGPDGTVYHRSAEGPYTGPPPEPNKPESPLLSAGNSYGCSIAVSKAVRCFGGDLDFFEATPPAGEFRQVSVGNAVSCGVRTDSTLACWGWILPGDPSASTGPPPAGSFRSVSVSGLDDICAVDAQYIVTCWGGEGPGEEAAEAGAVPDPGRYTEVSAGSDYTCGIHTDGTLACWGDGVSDGPGTGPPRGTFREVSVGIDEACGLTYLDEVTCWDGRGSTPHTQIGAFTEVDLNDGWACALDASGEPSCFPPVESYDPDTWIVPRAGSYTDLSVGNIGACARRHDGSVTCWGGEYSGQVTPAPGTFTGLTAGEQFTCGLRPDQSVACWGGADGEAPSRLVGSFLQISGGGPLFPETLCGVRTDHTLLCLGGTTPLSGTYREVAVAEEDGCAIATGSGSLDCWSTDGSAAPPVPPSGDFTQISAGGFAIWSRYCALRTDQTVVCWQPPRNMLPSASPPTGQFAKVVVGAYATDCGIRTDGTLSCWKTPSYLGPSEPPAGSFVDVAVAAQAACAIHTDGTITCWGRDEHGETDHPTGTFTQIVAGAYHMCALRSDGSAACWGHGEPLPAG